jgi:hypothetical protein
MRGTAIFIVAVIALLIWDWQGNNSRYTDAVVRMTNDMKRSILGR